MVGEQAGEDSREPPSPLVINEVRCTGGDWVELRNLGAEPLSGLGGWALCDDPWDPDHVWFLPKDLEIAAGARVVLRQDESGTAGFSFGLKCGQDTVTLLAPGGIPADAVTLPGLAEGLTWGRLPDGTGSWAENVPTPGAPNQGTGATSDPGDQIFDPFRVTLIYLTLPTDSVDALWVKPKEYVPATFNVPDGPGATASLPIGIRLKGGWGSFRELNDKAAFKVKFTYRDGDSWMGRKRITLNNMVQDPSMLHEVVAYGLFRAMGIPCPRVGYAWVTVNGEPYGLYALVEPYDDVFLQRVFPEGTGHLYENDYFVDVVPGAAPLFDMDEGDPEYRTDLQALIDAAHETPDDEWMGVMASVSDLPGMIRMWAVEQYMGHWDGYAGSANNYFLHADPSGFFTMLPWGTDQTFGDFLPYHDGAGALFRRCMDIPVCRQQYNLALADLLEILDGRDDAGFVSDLAKFLAPWADRDLRRPYDADAVAAGVQGVLDFLAARPPHCMDDIGCELDPNADLDGDGFSCKDDCDETDPGTHVGAEDICGDGIDQDCNGWVDDGWECPDCHEAWLRSVRYLVCTTPRPYEYVESHCEAAGSAPLILETPSEESWLQTQMEDLGVPGAWLPLTDQEEEGIFLWWDGSSPAYENWSSGEPNNMGDEDCTELILWGQWNDIRCDDARAVLCRDPVSPLSPESN